MLRTSLITVSFFFIACCSFCQELDLKFRNISREQGLSNSTAQCIYQDSEGFIWIGTADGLNRYDGYKTTVYQTNPADSGSISGNYISCISEDRQKNLWIGTSKGLNLFNRRNNKFTHFTHHLENAASLSSNGISCIYEDKKGNVWVGTMGGLNLVEMGGNKFNRFPNPYKSGNNISGVFEDRKGVLWVGSDGGGLFSFDKNNKIFHPYKTLQGSISTVGNNITAIAENKAGNLFIGTKGGGLFVLNTGQDSIVNFRHNDAEPMSLSSDVVKSLLADSKGAVWVGTENGGLNRLNISAGSFTHFENSPDDPASLSQKTTSAIFEDDMGNLWVGTHRGGVNLYCPSANKFRRYLQGRTGLSYKDVKTFFEDKTGIVWIGTDGGGINTWNRKAGTFEKYRHQPGNNGSVGSDAILHIVEDRQGNKWVGTWGGGLNLSLGNGRFKQFLHNSNDPSSISSNNVWRIFEDSRNNLWVGTFYGGLNLFDRKTQRFNRITTDSLKQTSFLGNNVVSINEDKYGNLWFGTDDGGLNCLDVNTNHFEHYFYQGKEGSAGGIGNLRVIFIDSKQRLWIGQKGLHLFNYNTKTFSLYSDNPVLNNENIQGITEDKKGVFWISTRNGLMAFNPDSKSLKQYTTTDGLQGLEFNQNACLRLSDGEMLFGGFNGFNIFNPLNMPADMPAAPVYITDLQIFNKSMQFGEPGSPLKSPVGQAEAITLQYEHSVFSLEYAALDYVSPQETRYAYKLDGFDKNWNYVGTQRKATFTNLDPGTYTFHVKSGSADGQWSNKEKSITIIIQPPFWMTWWFRAIAILVLLGTAYTLFFYHRKSEAKRLDEEKTREMQQMQLQFFTNISHEFRTPLSLISGPLEKIQQEAGILPAHAHYFQLMQRNVNRLMALISELMDFRKVEAGALKLKVMPGDLGLLVQAIADDFTELALQKNIRFEVTVPAPLSEKWFDPQVLEKVIINLIHNSFKYTTNGGSISIEVISSIKDLVPLYENELVVKSDFQAKEQVHIRITDTGKGISKESIRYLFERYYRITKEHLGSGVGLAFVKSLTLLHKGAIHVNSQLDKGTEIVISLPCSKEDYAKEEKWMNNSETGEVQLESIRYKTLYQETTTEAGSVNNGIPATARHILIVDDNEELRNFLKECLGRDYHISEAENGSLGLQKAREETPDLVISDVMMPVMDGIEFCRQLKEDIEISHIPFILLTAKNALQAKMDGIGGGADHYFSKPLSLELLQLTIRNLFEQRQKIKERYSRDFKVEVRELVHSVKDKEFMDSLLELMEKQLENTDLNVDYICQQIGMSKTKLYKKIKDITGQTINEFVRAFRLKKAIDIMTHEDVTVTEVMYRIGIQSHSYFTTVFKKEFGKTPSQFMNEMEADRKMSG